MFYQFIILEIFPEYTIMVWYIRVTARNGSTQLKKPKNRVFRYLDNPSTLRAKSSIKELTDLVNFYLYSGTDPYVFNQKIFMLKVMFLAYIKA